MVGAVFTLLLLAGVPVAVVLGLSTLIFILLSGELALLSSFLVQIYNGMANFALLAIPLFILAGEMMHECGITRQLIDLARVFIGRLRGGLAQVNLVANGFMAAIIGSAIAQSAMMSRIMVPEMRERGYPEADAAAITCVGSLLGPVIPPSMPFIVFAVMAQISVASMFLAGIVPGVMLLIGFILIVAIAARRRDYPSAKPFRAEEKRAIILRAAPALLVPVSILATIIFGFGSPTDAAAIAALVAAILGKFVYREFRIARLPAILLSTARNSAIVLFLIGTANAFGWVIIYAGIPQALSAWVASLTSSPTLFLLMVIAVLLVVGTILESMAALILLVPILLPIAQGTFGIEPVQFGVVTVLTLVIGLVTPPVGAVLYVVSAISGIRPTAIFRPMLAYVVYAIAVTVTLAVIPGLTTHWSN